jgi:hypothetical protein
MAQPARDNRISRRIWLLAGLGIPLLRARAEEPLVVSFDGDNIRVAAPGLHFLTGKPLERLKGAATVVFDSQITLFSDDKGTIFHRPVTERLIFSYDLWEERFSVSVRGASTRSKPGLTATQAEAFALGELAVTALGLAPDRPFWLRFELRARSTKELSSAVGDSGISLTGLAIDWLSRKPGADNPYYMRSAGPYRLADLPRTPPVRGPRG